MCFLNVALPLELRSALSACWLEREREESVEWFLQHFMRLPRLAQQWATNKLLKRTLNLFIGGRGKTFFLQRHLAICSERRTPRTLGTLLTGAKMTYIWNFALDITS